jgi:hypothetical protein
MGFFPDVHNGPEGTSALISATILQTKKDSECAPP